MTTLLNSKIRSTLPHYKSFNQFEYKRQVIRLQRRVIDLQQELIAALQKTVLQNEQLLEAEKRIALLEKPPLKITRADWWENRAPQTDDDLSYLKAKMQWLEEIKAKFLLPYVDPAALNVFAEGLSWRSLKEMIMNLEMEAEQGGNELELLAKARSLR